MGFFDNLKKVVSEISNVVEDVIEDATKNGNKSSANSSASNGVSNNGGKFKLLGSKHWVEEIGYGDGDSEYETRIFIDEVFEHVDSPAAEVEMLSIYNPDKDNFDEYAKPYVGIFLEQFVYDAVEEFKKSKTVKGAIQLTPLNGRFYFKAKKQYHEDMMYFYGLDRYDGFWENNALAVVYPKSYVGTSDEEKVIKMLDEAAESYTEIRKK